MHFCAVRGEAQAEGTENTVSRSMGVKATSGFCKWEEPPALTAVLRWSLSPLFSTHCTGERQLASTLLLEFITILS